MICITKKRIYREFMIYDRKISKLELIKFGLMLKYDYLKLKKVTLYNEEHVSHIIT